jgi:hypothetical protein
MLLALFVVRVLICGGRWPTNNVNIRPYKYPSLTADMLFRLWNAAIKDDDTLADQVIRGMYHCMLAFDP